VHLAPLGPPTLVFRSTERSRRRSERVRLVEGDAKRYMARRTALYYILEPTPCAFAAYHGLWAFFQIKAGGFGWSVYGMVRWGLRQGSGRASRALSPLEEIYRGWSLP
jgi:hypothetical protein